MSVAAPAAQANDIQNELANHLDVAERLDVEGSAPETGPDDVYGFDRNSVCLSAFQEHSRRCYVMNVHTVNRICTGTMCGYRRSIRCGLYDEGDDEIE